MVGGIPGDVVRIDDEKVYVKFLNFSGKPHGYWRDGRDGQGLRKLESATVVLSAGRSSRGSRTTSK